MKRYLILISVVVVLVVVVVAFTQGVKSLRAGLVSYEEVPAVSSVARGDFQAEIARDGGSVAWQLSYANLEGDVTQAHIHFGQKGVNGGITVFLCSNLGNGPAGTQPCPPAPATITGTFTAADVVATASAQGIAAGEYSELIRAIRAGVTYANVHSTKFPSGEVRSQIGPSGGTASRDEETEHDGH